jgi:DNA-binding response OmpR family regulator
MDAGAGAGMRTRTDERDVGARVLVVEDDADVARPLVLTLREEGYAVTWAASGWQALELLRESTEALDEPIRLVLLDLGLPDVDGLDVCRQARSTGFDGAILIISARGSELDRVVGLDLGADDYVAKPYRLAEVQARVRALLRRTARLATAGATPSPASTTAVSSAVAASAVAASGASVGSGASGRDGPWVEVDRDASSAMVGGVAVDLSHRECDVLRLLADQPGSAVTREFLIGRVWRPGALGSGKTLDVTVGRLRRRLAAADAPARVVAVRGVGYRLEPAEPAAPA